MASQLPSPDQKAGYVRKMFASIANRYDFMNDLMTLGLHRIWKANLAKLVSDYKPAKILDLCCGTGDLTALLAEANSGSQIVGVDFSPEMLQLAQECRSKPNVKHVLADALALPFENSSFEAITMSFGLRNVSNYRACLTEVRRVCMPGGRIYILDMSHPQGLWAWLTHAHRYVVVPLLGRLLGGSASAYEYLPNSIKIYLNQQQLAELMSETGWHDVQVKEKFGGVLAMHCAKAN